MKINDKNNQILDKVNKGIYAVSKSLPIEELRKLLNKKGDNIPDELVQKVFIKEHSAKSSFKFCGTEDTISNIKIHKGSCKCNLCVDCTTKTMKEQRRLLSEKSENMLYYPSTWTTPNILYNQLGNEIERLSKVIKGIQKDLNNFERFFKDFIFKTEITENKKTKDLNIHFHVLFAIPSIFLDAAYGKEQEVKKLLNKIEFKWRNKTGGYIYVDKTYKGSNWDVAKTFDEVKGWVSYLYKPYWISVGETRQGIKSEEEYFEDLLKVSNEVLGYVRAYTYGQKLLKTGGIFNKKSHKSTDILTMVK